MLAIVWALDNLRSYLYGAGSIKIFTDHQPLTFALGNRNFIAKLNRWKARIEKYNCELFYKPGKSNIVADALPRISSYMNHLGSDTATASEADADSVATIHSALEDASNLIPHVEVPINVYRNQLIFDPNQLEYSREQPHSGCVRHVTPIESDTMSNLTDSLKKFLKPSVVNGMPDAYLQFLQTLNYTRSV